MKKTPNPQKPNDFAKLPAFDEAMRKIVQVPKEVVAEREIATRTPRPKSIEDAD